MRKVVTITPKDKMLLEKKGVKQYFKYVEKLVNAEIPKMEKHYFNITVFGHCDGDCGWILHGERL